MAEPDVLIVSRTDDIHTRAVARELAFRGASAAVVQNRDFPGGDTIGFEWDGLIEGRRFGALEGDATWRPAVWLRRFESYDVAADLQAEYRSFATRSTEALFESMVCASARLVVNPPTRNRLVDYKPYQLHLARACGLPTPKFLFTNDPGHARAFIAAFPRVVTKAFVSWRFQLIETRFIDPDDMPDLASVSLCPVLLQEYLSGTTEYRVTIVGETVLTAKIDLTNAKFPVDGRIHEGRVLSADRLPAETERRLLRFHREAGLLYGAYDLRCDAEGLPHFLEVNPAGQFLFAEIEAGLPISAAMADLLLRRTV